MSFKKNILIHIMLCLFSCQNIRKNKIKIYSPNRSQCITVITESDYRYIIAGDHNIVPENNYVKLDAKQIGLVGDIFYGCWDKDGYKWEFYNYSAIILENQLDKSKYKFGNDFPKDEFSNDNVACFDFSFESMEVRDKYKKNVIIEY